MKISDAYEQLFEVNIKKLIDETTMSGPGADGSGATIEYGIRPCFITVGVGNEEPRSKLEASLLAGIFVG